MANKMLWMLVLAFGMVIVSCDNGTTDFVDTRPYLQIPGFEGRIQGMPNGLPPGNQRGNPGGLNGSWLVVAGGIPNFNQFLVFNDGNSLFIVFCIDTDEVSGGASRRTYNVSNGTFAKQVTHRYRPTRQQNLWILDNTVSIDWGRTGWFDRNETLSALTANEVSDQVIDSIMETFPQQPDWIATFSIDGDILTLVEGLYVTILHRQ